MNDNLQEVIVKYKNKGIIVDSALLLVFIVGTYDQKFVERFSRTSNYTENDYILISNFMSYFDKKVTSPHILTEVSNFIDNKEELLLVLKEFVKNTSEEFVNSSEVVEDEAFLKFGLADSFICNISKGQFFVLTRDNDLLGYLLNREIDAVNLNILKNLMPY